MHVKTSLWFFLFSFWVSSFSPLILFRELSFKLKWSGFLRLLFLIHVHCFTVDNTLLQPWRWHQPGLVLYMNVSPPKQFFISLNCPHDHHFCFYRKDFLHTISYCHLCFLKSLLSVALLNRNELHTLGLFRLQIYTTDSASTWLTQLEVSTEGSYCLRQIGLRLYLWGNFLDCGLMQEGLTHFGWCDPWAGGPGLCKEAGWDESEWASQ